MTYRGYIILARTHCTGVKLWELNDDGSLYISIFDDIFDDDSIVWYEIEGIEHLIDCTKLTTLEQAKKEVDKCIKENENG